MNTLRYSLLGNGLLVFAGCACVIGAEPRELIGSRLEAFAARPDARVVSSSVLGSLGTGNDQATVSAVVIRDPTATPAEMRGVRIDLAHVAGKPVCDWKYKQWNVMCERANAAVYVEDVNLLAARDSVLRGAVELQSCGFISRYGQSDAGGARSGGLIVCGYELPGRHPTELATLFTRALNTGVAFAQAASAAENPTLQSLLAEVRQLRATLERTMSIWPQAQILMQRAQLQQQRLESASRQLEQVREQVARSARESSAMAQQIKRFEELLVREQDARRRQDFESELKRLKAQLEEQALRDQQQQAREGQLAGQVQSEQSKLTELNDRLDALDRMLQSAQPQK